MLTRSFRRSLSTRLASLPTASTPSSDVYIFTHTQQPAESKPRPSVSVTKNAELSEETVQPFATFLRKKQHSLILPNPEVSTGTQALDTNSLFQSSLVTEQMAIMHACLYNAFDVPRARLIFNRLRSEVKPSPEEATGLWRNSKSSKKNEAPRAVFSVQTYEAFLKAYQMLAISPLLLPPKSKEVEN